ncbi:DUF983 domain-containing protein [Caulobacter segnis]|uniref:DUF983 domain-containing protein n=1 Tax=Caulobacter segnis TaxID=88688 RepID=UPI00240FB7A2|nr:DUF983 domain-containing protein [Caulobacter segnis]MDG2523186.1 DUF983 domain-containing protein [Caulobacter segnis]
MTDPNDVHTPPAPIISGLRCRCPRCGEGKLFEGFLKVAPACNVCGLNYGFADPADGPAFFVMTGIGCAIMALFAWIEIAYQPPIWFHFLFTLPLFTVGCLGTLRPVKAWLIASQFFHKAEDARFESVGKHGPF